MYFVGCGVHGFVAARYEECAALFVFDGVQFPNHAGMRAVGFAGEGVVIVRVAGQAI